MIRVKGAVQRSFRKPNERAMTRHHVSPVGMTLVVGLFAAACGGGAPGPTPTATTRPTAVTTISPTTSPSASPSATPGATPSPTPRGLRMGDLAAGKYQTNFFEPTLVLTLPEGWHEFFADEDDEIYLGSPAAELAISRAAEVVDPESRLAVDAPEDLLAWLTQHPSFDAPEPVAIQIGGVDSHYVDMPGPTGNANLFRFPGGDFHIPPGIATRIYVVPLDGQDLSLVVMPPADGSTEQAIEATAAIVESLELVE